MLLVSASPAPDTSIAGGVGCAWALPASNAAQHRAVLAAPVTTPVTLVATLITTFFKIFLEALYLCVFGSVGSKILLMEKTLYQAVSDWTAYRDLALQTSEHWFA